MTRRKQTNQPLTKKKAVTGRVRAIKKESSDLRLVEELSALEKLDNFKSKKNNKHILTVKVKKQPPPASAHPVSPITDEQIEEYLDAKRAAQAQEQVSQQEQPIFEQEDRKKRIWMWSGVTVCMLLVLVIWAFNIKAMFQQTNANNDNTAIDEWNKATSEISEQMNQMQADLEKIKDFQVEEIATTTAIVDLSTTSPSTTTSTIVEELKEKIEGVATST